jgi:hypothetical protein
MSSIAPFASQFWNNDEAKYLASLGQESVHSCRLVFGLKGILISTRSPRCAGYGSDAKTITNYNDVMTKGTPYESTED